MLTNFFPLFEVADEFVVRSLPYSDEALEEARRSHNATHSFFRHEDEIYAIRMEGPDLDLGKAIIIRKNQSPEIVVGIVRHLLFRTFIRKLPGLKPIDFYPLRFVSRKIEHDAMREYLPENLQGIVTFRRL